jgi:diguanylate cyclase (GGDEF)-like protein
MTVAGGGGDAVVTAVAEVLRSGRRPPRGAPGGEALDAVLDQLADIARFAQALAAGDLDQELRQQGVMAGSLKGLQAALRHVSWQAQRVAAGDLSQKVDFMGAFAEAFNSMVAALGEARATLEEQNAQLERLATTDALTGLWNRRKFNEVVEAEIARARRYSHPLSLCLLDVDHFKRVNDTCGHDAGDVVLRELAAVMRAELRAVDGLARWGGEEFVFLSPDTPLPGGRDVAERVRQSTARHVFPAVGRVTVSIGVTEYSSGDTLDVLISRADAALYRAKESGRDRVEVAV